VVPYVRGSFEKKIEDTCGGAGGEVGCLEPATSDRNSPDALVLTILVLGLGIERSQGRPARLTLYGKIPGSNLIFRNRAMVLSYYSTLLSAPNTQM